MTARFPLQQLLDLAALRTDEATRELGRRIAAEHDARERLKLLETYRDEYGLRFAAAQARGLTPAEWANFQDFLARLDDAIGQQALAVDQSAQHRAAGQQDWCSENSKLKAYDTLADRHRRREQRAEDRREQKQTDEVAARRALPPRTQ